MAMNASTGLPDSTHLSGRAPASPVENETMVGTINFLARPHPQTPSDKSERTISSGTSSPDQESPTQNRRRQNRTTLRTDASMDVLEIDRTDAQSDTASIEIRTTLDVLEQRLKTLRKVSEQKAQEYNQTFETSVEASSTPKRTKWRHIYSTKLEKTQAEENLLQAEIDYADVLEESAKQKCKASEEIPTPTSRSSRHRLIISRTEKADEIRFLQRHIDELVEISATDPATGPAKLGKVLKYYIARPLIPETKRSRETGAQKALRKELVRLYKATDGASDKNEFGKSYWCPILSPILNIYFARVRAAHIIPHAIGPHITAYALGIVPDRFLLNTPQNGLILQEKLEEYYNQAVFVIVPKSTVREDENVPDTLVVKLLDWSKANHQIIEHAPHLKWKDIDNHELVFKSDFRPARRNLYYHFVCAVLVSRLFAFEGPQGKGCTAEEEVWATPGPWMRKSFMEGLGGLIGHRLPAASRGTFEDGPSSPRLPIQTEKDAMCELISSLVHMYEGEQRDSASESDWESYSDKDLE